jgi:hypothetical protein
MDILHKDDHVGHTTAITTAHVVEPKNHYIVQVVAGGRIDFSDSATANHVGNRQCAPLAAVVPERVSLVLFFL